MYLWYLCMYKYNHDMYCRSWDFSIPEAFLNGAILPIEINKWITSVNHFVVSNAFQENRSKHIYHEEHVMILNFKT